MTTKSFTKKDKKGREETWEWEETPQLVEALKQLHRPLESRKVTEEDTLTNLSLGEK